MDSLEINLVLDVGANEGQYANYLRVIGYKGNIHCFEPLSSAYGRLIRFAAHDGKISVAPQMALGDHDGEISINIAANSESSSVLPMLDAHLHAAPASKYIGSERVPLRRLGSVLTGEFVAQHNTFLKIDAQGYERQIISGASDHLDTICAIQLELSLIPLYQGEPLYRDMIDFLESLGFALFDISPTFADSKSGRVYQVDSIFVRKEIL